MFCDPQDALLLFNSDQAKQTESPQEAKTAIMRALLDKPESGKFVSQKFGVLRSGDSRISEKPLQWGRVVRKAKMLAEKGRPGPHPESAVWEGSAAMRDRCIWFMAGDLPAPKQFAI